MRKLFTESNMNEYPGEKEMEKDFIDSIRNEKSNINSILYGRVNEFSGVIMGWVPTKDDPIYTLEGNYLSKNTILITDRLSELIINKEPFYQYSFPSRGPIAIAPWILTIIAEYAISKGIDWLFEKLYKNEIKDISRKISIEWGNDNGDSLGQIKVDFTDGSSFTIENYPHSIERITVKQLDNIQKEIKKEKPIAITYNAWGRVIITEKYVPGTYIDIGK